MCKEIEKKKKNFERKCFMLNKMFTLCTERPNHFTFNVTIYLKILNLKYT